MVIYYINVCFSKERFFNIFWILGNGLGYNLNYILQNVDRYRGPFEIVFQRFSI